MCQVIKRVTTTWILPLFLSLSNLLLLGKRRRMRTEEEREKEKDQFVDKNQKFACLFISLYWVVNQSGSREKALLIQFERHPLYGITRVPCFAFSVVLVIVLSWWWGDGSVCGDGSVVCDGNCFQRYAFSHFLLFHSTLSCHKITTTYLFSISCLFIHFTFFVCNSLFFLAPYFFFYSLFPPVILFFSLPLLFVSFFH